MENQTVYYVKTDDPNIGSIWTLLPAKKAYGEKRVKSMTLRKFLDTNWSRRDDAPSEGDLHGILTELVDQN